MSKQINDLAWDITDWDLSADLGINNVHYSMAETFLRNGLVVPESIICRIDQKHRLLKEYKQQIPDGSDITSIEVPNIGIFKLKVLPLYREEITKARAS